MNVEKSAVPPKDSQSQIDLPKDLDFVEEKRTVNS